MKEVKLVVNGIGNIGSNLVRLISQKKGVKIVGVVDVDPEKIGTDAGLYTGEDIGCIITEDLLEVCKNEKPDLVISTTTPTTAQKSYEEVIQVLDLGINVLTANMGTCNLWVTEPKLAETIDKKCKEKGVSYLGIGATQVQDRFILANTEGCSKIDKITFTHFADMHAFSDESIKREWGVLLTEEEWYTGLENGTIERHEYFKDGIYYLASHIGWDIDDITYEQLPWVDENKKVYACVFKIQGFQNDICKMETNWVFIRDPEKRYYDRVTIEGVPYIDSMNTYTPDRGLVCTFAALANAVPFVIKANPGYLSSLDVPACTLIDNEYYKHI